MEAFAQRALPLVLLAAASWGAGLVCYAVTLRTMFGQRASSGDWTAVLFWSGLLTLLFVALVLWPLATALSARFSGPMRFIVLTAAGVVTASLPVLVLTRIFQARRLGPEGFLFLTAFAAAGATFGIGYAAAAKWLRWEDS